MYIFFKCNLRLAGTHRPKLGFETAAVITRSRIAFQEMRSPADLNVGLTLLQSIHPFSPPLRSTGPTPRSQSQVPAMCRLSAAKVQDYLEALLTDTQVALFRKDGQRELVLSIRGTSSLPDALTDLSIIPVPYEPSNEIPCKDDYRAHAGFHGA